MQEILDFISRRWNDDAHWLDGNCYWFSTILCLRFPQLEIYYCPINGHFLAGTAELFYDWTGLVEPKEQPILLDDIRTNDPLWYEHLMRDCRD